VGKPNTPGCGSGAGCCAPGVCRVGLEDFANYDDGTTIDGWTELVNDWEIVGSTLTPESAASDSVIRWDTPTADLDCAARVLMDQGSAGDSGGAALFFDADGDSYVAALVELGAGTAGRLSLVRYDNGTLTWTKTVATAPSCGANEYDFDPTLTHWVSLSHRVVHGGRVWRATVNQHVDLGDGPVWSMDYFDTAAIAGATVLYGGAATGTDATTLAFLAFILDHIHADCNCHQVGEIIDVNGLSPAGEFSALGFAYDCFDRAECDYPGAEYEEVAGDWDIELFDHSVDPWASFEDLLCGRGHQLATDSVPATILFRHKFRSPDAHIAIVNFGTRLLSNFIFDGLTWRYLWDYEDDDNYWCIEYEFGDWDLNFNNGVDNVRVIERAGGAETVHASLLGILNRDLAALGLGAFINGATNVSAVYVDGDGYVAASVSDWTQFGTGTAFGYLCAGPFSFNGNGRCGLKVVAAEHGFTVGRVTLYDAAGECDNYSAQCTTLVDGPTANPGDPDPGDPTGCCDDAAQQYGDEWEITIANITYFTGGDCLTECTEIDSTWITNFNSTFTGRVIWRNDTYFEIDANTGIDNPCDGYAKDAPIGYMHIKVRVRRVSETECQAQGWIYIPGGGTCGLAYFESNLFGDGDDCDTHTLNWVSGSLNGCCLNATSGATLTLVKV